MTISNPNIRKKQAFEAFLKVSKGGVVAYWTQIANAIGVNKDTITEWKKHPLAQKAIRDGIEHALGNMERAGKDDWKMWEHKLRMLGVFPISKDDIPTGSGSITVIEKTYLPNEK